MEFLSTGPTAGTFNEDEIPEEKAVEAVMETVVEEDEEEMVGGSEVGEVCFENMRGKWCEVVNMLNVTDPLSLKISGG